MPVVANQVLQLDDRHAVALLDVAGKAQQGQSSWAFRQVGLVNNVAKGKRKTTMASGRLSMVGPFSESGVRPAYPIFILFLTFVESPTWKICTVETRKRHSPQSGSQNPCLSSTDEETTAFVTRCGKPGDGISRYFDWFRQSREYRNRLFRHSRAA